MRGSLRRIVYERAGGRCEYCRLHERDDATPFQVDHIVARKHGGDTTESNLCLCCLACNAFNSANIAGLDPETGELHPLFHLRSDEWSEHFEWRGPLLLGRTPVGRTTIEVLDINRSDRLEHRRLLIELGRFP